MVDISAVLRNQKINGGKPIACKVGDGKKMELSILMELHPAINGSFHPKYHPAIAVFPMENPHVGEVVGPSVPGTWLCRLTGIKNTT
jgi:hypothetical protein